MKNYYTEKVIKIKHWNEHLFSFKCSRNAGLRFENGQFVMMGMVIDNKPVLRAYSIASANYEDYLEFFSIKVPDGKLTSRLQNIQVGDEVLLSKKPTGSILLHDLKPGKHLYLLATGTGLAPFISIIKDIEVYEKFEKVILVHGVRFKQDLAYEEYITQKLPSHEFVGDLIKNKLVYYPTVTREYYKNQGRITDLIRNKKFFRDLNLPVINPEIDRVMVCGSTSMLNEIVDILDERDLCISPRIGYQGDYVIERAFVGG